MSYPDRTPFSTFPSGGRPGSPREFSVSLLCSLLLHAALAVVLLQDVRLPSVEIVRDVFLAPDWIEPAAEPRARVAGGGPPELPPRSSPAAPRVGRRTPTAPKIAEENRVPSGAQPSTAPKPAPAPRVAAPPAAPRAAEIARAPAVAPDAVAPSLPVPQPRPSSPVRAPAVAPDAVAPSLPVPEPRPAPPVSAPAPGPVQAPAAVAQATPKVEEAPLPPPSEWRDAQPLLPARTLPTAPPETPVAAPVPPPSPAPVTAPAPPAPAVASRPAPIEPPATPALPAPIEEQFASPAPVEPPVTARAPAPSIPVAPPAPVVQPPVAAPTPPAPPLDVPVAPPAPSLGLPAPPVPLPPRAATVPDTPLPSPLDWEVPAAVERDSSSVGRTPEGATAAITPAAPPVPITSPQATAPPRPQPSAGEAARTETPSRVGSGRPAAPARTGQAEALGGPTAGSAVASGALQAQRSAERATVGVGGQGVAPSGVAAPPTFGAIAGSGVLSAQRGGERMVFPPGGATAQGGTNAQGGTTTQGGTSAQSGAIAQGGAGNAVVATAPTLGNDVAGPATGAVGGSSGTEAESTAPTLGPAIATGTAPGDVTSETGVGSGGQAVTEGGGAGEGQRGAGRGPGNIAITTPQNGYTLSADDPPIVIVRGQVDDPEISSIWLTANKRRVEVRVRDGKFYYPLVVVDPTTKISAELPTSTGRRSEAITVHAAPNALTTGVVLIDWGEEKPAGAIDVGVTWRARADRLDGRNMKLFAKTATLPDDIPVSAYYLRNMQSGVYTFTLSYRGLGAGTPFTPRFFLTSPGVPTARDLKPITLSGTGIMAPVRVLLPHAVLWDQDDWFTGRSEASDTMTKFRDDGTSWIERKGAPGR